MSLDTDKFEELLFLIIQVFSECKRSKLEIKC